MKAGIVEWTESDRVTPLAGEVVRENESESEKESENESEKRKQKRIRK